MTELVPLPDSGAASESPGSVEHLQSMTSQSLIKTLRNPFVVFPIKQESLVMFIECRLGAIAEKLHTLGLLGEALQSNRRWRAPAFQPYHRAAINGSCQFQ